MRWCRCVSSRDGAAGGSHGSCELGDCSKNGGDVDLGGDSVRGDHTDGVGESAGGEMGKGRLGSSSLSLRSSSSQRRFRIFFAGGGTVGEGAWAKDGGMLAPSGREGAS